MRPSVSYSWVFSAQVLQQLWHWRRKMCATCATGRCRLNAFVGNWTWISERIVPQLVPAINLEEHSKQTKFSACDEFASEIWAGYLEKMIRRNDKELAAIFKRFSEEVMAEQGYPNTMKLGLWVHPYKLIGNVCRALATSDWGVAS
jgi:hypothetical protein